MAPFQDRSFISDVPFTSFGNFDLVQRLQLDYTDVVVSKWRSRITGLTLVHLDYEGAYLSLDLTLTSDPLPAPLINGYFVVATESKPVRSRLSCLLLTLAVFNDTGCPHTLEQ